MGIIKILEPMQKKKNEIKTKVFLANEHMRVFYLENMLRLAGMKIKVTHSNKLFKQCDGCKKFDHTKSNCQEGKTICYLCGHKDHKGCFVNNARLFCVNCNRYGHHSFNIDCPTRAEYLARLLYREGTIVLKDYKCECELNQIEQSQDVLEVIKKYYCDQAESISKLNSNSESASPTKTGNNDEDKENGNKKRRRGEVEKSPSKTVQQEKSQENK